MPYLVPRLLSESTLTVSGQKSSPQARRQCVKSKYLLKLLAMNFFLPEYYMSPPHEFIRNDQLHQVLYLEDVLASDYVFFHDPLFPEFKLLPFLALLLRHLPLDLV